MRLVNVFPVFLAAVACLLIPLHGAIASEGAAFVAWALEQGEGLDRAWDRITAGATPAAAGGSNTAAPARSYAVPAGLDRSTAANWNAPGGSSTEWSPFNGKARWIHPTSGFVHKGELELLPLSTRDRGSPSRGTSKLRNPASTRLGISHDYRRVPNARVPAKNFFQSRSGKWRISTKMGTRISQSSRRGRVSARSSTRISRPR